MLPRFSYIGLRICRMTAAIIVDLLYQSTGSMSYSTMLAIAKSTLFSSVLQSGRSVHLEHYGCNGYKIASPESTWLTEQRYHELMEAIYETGERYMVSSGKRHMDAMTNYMEPDVLFYCKAGYPAVVEDADVSYMADLSASPLINHVVTAVGFSDHTVGFRATMAMIGAGAKVIEKHFKLNDECVDAAFSLNKDQMKRLCEIAHR